MEALVQNHIHPGGPVHEKFARETASLSEVHITPAVKTASNRLSWLFHVIRIYHTPSAPGFLFFFSSASRLASTNHNRILTAINIAQQTSHTLPVPAT